MNVKYEHKPAICKAPIMSAEFGFRFAELKKAMSMKQLKSFLQ